MAQTPNKKITAVDIEIAVAKYFGWRQNVIVPNVSWGLHIHECDMLILSGAGYATEVEIKISKADLIKDKMKRHGHRDNRIKSLYFAIPEKLCEYQEHVPAHAGILFVHQIPDSEEYSCKEFRKPTTQNSVKFTEKEKYELCRLGIMRIWAIKTGVKYDCQVCKYAKEVQNVP